ncbi:MAG: DNA polymerase III subunit delta [Lewinellaceae bacterium]|nr:DNA polymerase III subunit delta [Lewinellaceae bacterium]
MEFSEILRQLHLKQYHPVYFLHGTEPYFIDQISDYIEHQVLGEAEKAFNLTVLYGKEADHLQILDAARRYPVMSPHQVVVIKEAQEMKSLTDLLSYIEKPAPSTILVIAYRHKKYNLNSNFGKALKKNAVILETKRLYDNQVPDWIIRYAKERQLAIAPAEAGLIAEYLGAELSKVANELDKLALNVPSGTTVTREQIEEYIGISREYNVFELHKALASRDWVKTFRMVQYFSANPKKSPFVVIIGALYGFFSKVYILHFLGGASEKELLEKMEVGNAFFLKDYKLAARHYNRQQTEHVLELLKDYDLKAKGVHVNTTNVPEGELLKEMVWRIVHE